MRYGACMRDWIAVAVMSASLAACGNGEAGDALADGATAAAPVPEVVVRVSGAHSGTFESTGSIYCTGDPFGSPEEGFELYAMKMPEQLSLRMPRDTKPGRYSMTGGTGAPIDFYYADPQRVKYDQIESATIQLDAVPQAQGERLIGSIGATLQSDKGQAVEVEIQLDLDAGAQSFDECE